jgi:hypothetical protein
VLLTAAACSGRATPPSADTVQRAFPDIGGMTVMLLPVQMVTPMIGAPAGADTTKPPVPLSRDIIAGLEAELAYWLPERASRTRWVLPDAIVRAADRSPGLNVRPSDLPVRDFLRLRLESIGDPLYGELRKLNMLVDARIALLPIGAVWVPEQAGGGRVHLAVALIDTFGGNVVWYGIVAGSAGAFDDAAVAASTARALAGMIPR